MYFSSHEQSYCCEHEERYQVDGDRQGYRLSASKELFDEQCVGDVDGDECCDDQEIAVQAGSFCYMFGEYQVDATYHHQDSCVVCQCCWFVEQDD